uniref:Tyrosine-protein kinase n=1 Tax=Ditylenchus dipsaci TaxID=166011 RepID=A0A915E8T8_9BILA
MAVSGSPQRETVVLHNLRAIIVIVANLGGAAGLLGAGGLGLDVIIQSAPYSFADLDKQKRLSSTRMSDELPNNFNSVAIQTVAITSKKALLSLEKNIQDELYYHGFMSKLEAEVLLKKHGHFLVRRIQEATNLYYVVSVQWKEEKLHYKINQTSRKHYFYLNRECKKTVVGLIRFHRQNQVPINETTKACLKKTVNRHHYTIFREQVTLGAYISAGEFGAVYAGLLRVGLFSRLDVAVKTMKLDEDKLSMDQRIVFLREANIMMRLKHKNVIRLYGVCVYEDPIWIVMECAKGYLSSVFFTLQPTHLRRQLVEETTNSESAPDETLKIKFSKEICLGMAYLESFMVIHRDLAARNCLLGKKETVKIVAITSKKALLSLEKNIQDELYYHGFMSKLEAEVLLKKHGHFLTVVGLIRFHRQNQVPINETTKACLKKTDCYNNIDSKNVIRLYGVCVYEDPIWIVMECAKGGSLLKRLQNSESAPDETLKIKFSKEICLGMAYLESFMVIHRDLAARNCLLGKKETIKIADFGLSNKGLKALKIGASDVCSSKFGQMDNSLWEELSVRQIGQGSSKERSNLCLLRIRLRKCRV